jgi:hypothetical protein
MEHIPFGDKINWDSVDESIATDDILNESILNYLIIDLDFQNPLENSIDDRSGNNIKGVFINDYGIKFDNETLEPEAQSSINLMRVSSNDIGKPY